MRPKAHRRTTPGVKRPALAVGLMSGTSADGIDAVLARLSGSGRGLEARILRHVHLGFPKSLRNQILHVCLHGGVEEICELNFLLGEKFAAAVKTLLARSRIDPGKVRVIGSHGQTIHHLPQARHPATLQIGEPSIIAERTGITTVADFRVRDMAAGGQGAPLVPYADWALLSHSTKARIVQNIGGIGNLTFLPAGAGLDKVLAFDTGPGNMVIDAVVAHFSDGRLGFDRNGVWAAKGRVHPGVLSRLLGHPFFGKRPPKTTGREEFGEGFVRELLGLAAKHRMPAADVVATATALTAASIAQAYWKFIKPHLGEKPEGGRIPQVILGGGGARNGTLREMLAAELRRHFAGFELLTHRDFGIADEAKEALAFAILAYETLQGQPSNVPAATGARRAVVLGKIIPGSSNVRRSNRLSTLPES